MKIRLQQVIDAIEQATDEWTGFYDLQTGETVWLGDRDFDDDYEETAELIDSSYGRFIRFPTKFEIHEYSIMEDFVDDLPAGAARNKLMEAIRGRGAFRRFKDTIYYYGIEQQWYDYQAEAYRRIAIRWCRDEGIEYEERSDGVSEMANMKKLLVVVDMQNDFVTGVLGSKDAEAIIPAVLDRVKEAKAASEDIVFTRDTHHDDYMSTREGNYLPVPHCIEGTHGWEIIDELKPYADGRIINKPTFGSTDLVEFVGSGDYDEIELIGLCTDICVVSNALLLKANFPEKTYVVDASCCAGITEESHEAALLTMQMCHIEIVNS